MAGWPGCGSRAGRQPWCSSFRSSSRRRRWSGQQTGWRARGPEAWPRAVTAVTALTCPPPLPTAWGATHGCRLQGLVDAVGLSNYGPKQLARIGAYLDKRGVPLAAVQVQYSLLRCVCVCVCVCVLLLFVFFCWCMHAWRPVRGVHCGVWGARGASSGQRGAPRQPPPACAAARPMPRAAPAPEPCPALPCPACSRGPEQASVKAACDDLGVALIAYSPLALGAARAGRQLSVFLACCVLSRAACFAALCVAAGAAIVGTCHAAPPRLRHSMGAALDSMLRPRCGHAVQAC